MTSNMGNKNWPVLLLEQLIVAARAKSNFYLLLRLVVSRVTKVFIICYSFQRVTVWHVWCYGLGTHYLFDMETLCRTRRHLVGQNRIIRGVDLVVTFHHIELIREAQCTYMQLFIFNKCEKDELYLSAIHFSIQCSQFWSL